MIEMDTAQTDFQIIPETKIGTLLDRFPQLEDTLMGMAPRFKQLRNPVLRKTIARVASLSQVAAIGKVSLVDMINRLREAAGIEEKFAADIDEEVTSSVKPDWFAPDRITVTLDAGPLLEAGEHPIQRILSECRVLKNGEIYELNTPFLPVPLIEKALKQGFQTWSKEDDEGVYHTYFTPRP
jgi:hypothetical protein